MRELGIADGSSPVQEELKFHIRCQVIIPAWHIPVLFVFARPGRELGRALIDAQDHPVTHVSSYYAKPTITIELRLYPVGEDNGCYQFAISTIDSNQLVRQMQLNKVFLINAFPEKLAYRVSQFYVKTRECMKPSFYEHYHR